MSVVYFKVIYIQINIIILRRLVYINASSIYIRQYNKDEIKVTTQPIKLWVQTAR